MKKVLFIAPQPFFQWRGSPIRVSFNARALAELGYQVDLLVMPMGEDRVIPGVRLLRIPNVLGVRDLPIGPSRLKAFYDVFLYVYALGLAIRHRYDVIHGVEDAGPIAVIAGRLTGARVVFEKHSDPGSYRKGWARNVVMWLYRRVEAFSIRKADAVIGTGPALVEEARRVKADVVAHHIFDIPSSLTEAVPERVEAIRRAWQENEARQLVVYVGSFAVYQGIDLMFEAMPRVVQQNPRARFVVIGGTSEEIAERKRWLTKRGIDGAVVFPGKIPPDDLPSHLAAADVLLSPRSAGNNTPLKLLDYLKAGRAIVATDHEANRLILDDTCAVLVEASPPAYAEGICRLLSDVALRERLGRCGRRKVEAQYNFAEFKRRLAACYAGL